MLQINRPNEFEHPWVYDDANVGFRSTLLDLKRPEANARAKMLAEQADIFVENFKGHKLARLGFSPEQLAELCPGIIVVSVKCYGWEGPWSERGGFDMLGSAASGLAMLEGMDGKPSMPPTALINDYVTGYLGAAGATAALISRANEGGSYHVTVSLTRNAMWYQSLGLMPPEERSFAENPFRHLETLTIKEMVAAQKKLKERLLAPDVIERDTPMGRLRRLAPAVNFSETPAHWDDPLLVPMGSCDPVWFDSNGH